MEENPAIIKKYILVPPDSYFEYYVPCQMVGEPSLKHQQEVDVVPTRKPTVVAVYRRSTRQQVFTENGRAGREYEFVGFKIQD